MNSNTANSEIVAGENDRLATHLGQVSDSREKSFARQLRALGQALEKFSFSTFHLEIENGIYLVVAKTNATEGLEFSFSRFVREFFSRSSFPPNLTGSDHQVDLRFTSEDIEQVAPGD